MLSLGETSLSPTTFPGVWHTKHEDVCLHILAHGSVSRFMLRRCCGRSVSINIQIQPRLATQLGAPF